MSLYKLVIIHDVPTQTFTLTGYNEVKDYSPSIGASVTKWSLDGATLTFNSLEETLNWLKKNYK